MFNASSPLLAHAVASKAAVVNLKLAAFEADRLLRAYRSRREYKRRSSPLACQIACHKPNEAPRRSEIVS